MQPAFFAHPLSNHQIECRLCPHYCRLRPAQTGLCRVRHNIGGQLVTSAYGRPIIMAVEPIEKKYLFHLYPGSQTLSLGTAGCNLGCKYCINWRVSQRGVAEQDQMVTPAEVVTQACELGVEGIAFTYTEPTIFFEYAQEIAHLAHQAGLFVVAKSNGYITPPALKQMAGWLDGINIDLKGWQAESHHQIVGAPLPIILQTLKQIVHLGLWLEVSTLIVPHLNDSPHDLEQIAHFIAHELGPDVPWHLLRFYPNYLMQSQPVTAQQTLKEARTAAQKAGLKHIYSKELSQGQQLHTTCRTCQTTLISRKAYGLLENRLQAGKCPTCGQSVAGVWARHS